MSAAPARKADWKQARELRDMADRWTALPALFDKVPPHALESEMALLGAMIFDWQVIGDVVQTVGGPDDFYKAGHAHIYKALVDLYDKEHKIDLVQLHQMLQDRGVLDDIGGMAYLVELVNGVPHAVHAPYYAEIVRKKAVLRKLIDAAGKIVYDAYHAPEDVAGLLDQAEKEIFKLAEGKGDDDPKSLKELLDITFQHLEAMEGKSLTGVESGYSDLDNLTSGLQPNEMIILAARPSMGKTTLALNMAEHIAVNLNQPIAFFSLEMSKQQLAQRLLCARSGVDSQRLRRNMLREDDWKRLHVTHSDLSHARMYIDDSPGLTILALRAKARRLKAKHQVRAIFIDYLQLLSSPGAAGESRQQEVSEISRSIKALARELEVPVVCLSQLNRSPEGVGQTRHRRPRMSDLRESGSIEQDADVIMMLYREDYHHRGDLEWSKNNPEKVGLSELIITKQRNGPTGTVFLRFDGAITKFFQAAAPADFDGGE